MNITEWMDLAIERAITYRKIGEAFELKDLFNGEEWNQLTRGERTTFGRTFANAVRTGQTPGVEMLPLGKSRHNRYARVS